MPPVSSSPGLSPNQFLPLPGQPVVEAGHRNQHADGDHRTGHRVAEADQAIERGASSPFDRRAP
jgi:hypothetical protein